MNDKFWDRIREGNEQAFQELYDEYSELLYGYGMKIVNDADMVTNAIQTLFIHVFEKRATLSVPQSIPAYLCVSLRRLIIYEMKKGSKIPTKSFDDAKASEYNFELEIDSETAIINSEHGKEQLEELQKRLNGLTRQQREVIYLKYYQGLDTENISKILDISNQTVRNTASMALHRLRKMAGGEDIMMAILFMIIILL